MKHIRLIISFIFIFSSLDGLITSKAPNKPQTYYELDPVDGPCTEPIDLVTTSTQYLCTNEKTTGFDELYNKKINNDSLSFTQEKC